MLKILLKNLIHCISFHFEIFDYCYFHCLSRNGKVRLSDTFDYTVYSNNRGVKRSGSHVVGGSHCCQNYNGHLWG